MRPRPPNGSARPPRKGFTRAIQSRPGLCQWTRSSEEFAEAVKWFRKAAEQGYADAQFSLGDAYRTGTGVAKDNAEASDGTARRRRKAIPKPQRLSLYGKSILIPRYLKRLQKGRARGCRRPISSRIEYQKGEGVAQNDRKRHAGIKRPRSRAIPARNWNLGNCTRAAKE